ncbi:MAG: cryptochrome/photolyase family protein [Bacteroidetes bacterium]|nr:cryptochrome/photolyase family protein [Bacteroidota bacterium]
MNTVFLLFPNCLFKDTGPLTDCDSIFMVEEFLFFKLYKFHKQKIVFHRAAMKSYEDYLKDRDFNVHYVPATDNISDIRLLIPYLKKQGISTIKIYDPCDDWLEKRIKKSCATHNIELHLLENLLFINSTSELSTYKDKAKKYFQTDFYIYQRKLREVLVDDALNPLHDKWSFDADNRLKYPKDKKVPATAKNYISQYHSNAAEYVEKYFAANYGEINQEYFYPINHEQAEAALADFLLHRFSEFGIYEDAIVKGETFLNHSVLSPLINAGLLLPGQVIDEAIAYAQKNNIPYNSVEGFVRQILGWREFIRMVYVREGSNQRIRNFWKFKRKIPASFYTGNTGIAPIDATIKKLQKSAYNHHIERLMILSNFMLLCEFDPDEVYKWFMEMYIDAYDWVMVPNIYGMGQFSAGGLMCTKPYISGSNYIFKMSDYKKGEAWAEIWDALFWRFMHVHRSFFLQNPRLGMLVKTFDKWQQSKQNDVLKKAEVFLKNLDT